MFHLTFGPQTRRCRLSRHALVLCYCPRNNYSIILEPCRSYPCPPLSDVKGKPECMASGAMPVMKVGTR